jgi:hypothetical protein
MLHQSCFILVLLAMIVSQSLAIQGLSMTALKPQKKNKSATFSRLFSYGDKPALMDEEDEPEPELGSPTQSPSFEPTFEPSFTPSWEPSFEPTFSPTWDHVCSLRFLQQISLKNVSACDLTNGGEQALIESLVDVTQLPVNNIAYNGLLSSTASGSRRKLGVFELQGHHDHEEEPSHVGDGPHDLIVEVEFTIPLIDFPSYNGDDQGLYSHFVSLLQQSLIDPSSQIGSNNNLFTEKLNHNALIWGKELFFAKSDHFNFLSNQVICENESDPVPTGQPTSLPTSSPTATTIENYLEFEVFWTLSGLLGCNTVSAEGQLALLQTIAEISDIDVSQISIISSSSLTSPPPIILSSLPQIITNTVDSCDANSVKIGTRIMIAISDFSEFNGNSTKIYLYLTSLLSESVTGEEKIFQKILRQEAEKVSASELCNVVICKIEYYPYHIEQHHCHHDNDHHHQHHTGGGDDHNGGENGGDNNNGGSNNNGGNNNNGSGDNNNGAGDNHNNHDHPTYTPPTYIPPDHSKDTMIQYKATFWIKDLVYASSSHKQQQQLASSDADKFNTDSQKALMNSILITQHSSYESVEYLGIRTVISDDQLVIATRLTFDYSQIIAANPLFFQNATMLFQNTSTILSDAVNSHYFDTILRALASSYSASQVISATVIRVEFEDFQITEPIVNSNSEQSPSKSEDFLSSTAFLPVIICGSFAMAVLLFFAIYIGYRRYYNEKDTKSLLGSNSSSVGENEPINRYSTSFGSSDEGILDDEDNPIYSWDIPQDDDVFVINIMDDYNLNTEEGADGSSILRSNSTDLQMIEPNESKI